MDHERRVALLKRKIKALGLNSMLITDAANVSYLSGFSGDSSIILITREKAFFITDSRYVQEAEKSIRGFDIKLVTESTYETVCGLIKSNRIRALGFESMDMPYAAALKFKSLLTGVTFSPAKDIVEQFRAIKDGSEIAAIKKSVILTKYVFHKTLRSLSPGATEMSLANNIEIDFLKNGAKAAFDPIVASGINSSKPHATPGQSRIGKGGFMMVDIGCKLNGYCSDMTRTVILGAIGDKFASIYRVVREAQQRAIMKVRAGVRISEVDFAARGYIHSKGFGKCFGHSLGHGVGLEIHEQPTVSRSSTGFLKKGMVVTIEPAIYVPGFGGVRIEDMVLVTDKGCENLTC